MKIGVLIESFKKDFASSLAEAAALGVQGIQAYADTENVNADLSARQVMELRKQVEDAGLKFSALCGDFGCRRAAVGIPPLRYWASNQPP